MELRDAISATVETGWTRYQENNAKIGYLGRFTKSASNSGYSGNYMIYVTDGLDENAVKNSYISFNFTGSALRIYNRVGPTWGEFIVKIDDKEYTVDTHDENTNNPSLLVFQIDNLPTTGIHRCFLINKGTDRFAFDCLEMPTGQTLIEGCGIFNTSKILKNRYTHASYAITFDGTIITSSVGGGFKGSETLGDTIEFYFYGSKLYLNEPCYNNRSNAIEVYIDGELDMVVNPWKPSGTTRNPIIYYQYFDKVDSNFKLHHVKLVNKTYNTSCTAMTLGRVDTDGFICTKDGLYMDITPVQTSNTAPAKVTCGNYYSSSYYPWIPFNGADNAQGTGWSSSNLSPTNYIQIVNTEEMNINCLEIVSKSVSGYSPKKFHIEDEKGNILQEFTINDDWNEETKRFKLKDTINNKLFKLVFTEYIVPISSTGSSARMMINNIRLLYSVSTKFMALKCDDKYYGLGPSKTPLELPSLEGLDVEPLTNKFFSSFNDMMLCANSIECKNKSIVSLTNRGPILIEGTTSLTGLIVLTNNIILSSKANINNISLDGIVKSVDGSIKVVIYNVETNKWMSFDGQYFTGLDINIPFKNYKDMTDEEKNDFNNALNTIISDGINMSDLPSINFNDLMTSKIRLAFAIDNGTSKTAFNQINKLDWEFDEKNSLKQIDTEVVQILAGNTIILKPTEDIAKMVVNVSTN